MKNALFISGLILVLLLIFFLQGCGEGTLEKIRDPDFILGCKVVEADAKLGYFNQEGTTVVCKVKCTTELPENFIYRYDNDRTGCHVEVGKQNAE